MTLKRNIILCFLILAMSAMSYAGESRQTTGQEDRRLWVSILVKISDPVLTNLANGTLRANMPQESLDDIKGVG